MADAIQTVQMDTQQPLDEVDKHATEAQQACVSEDTVEVADVSDHQVATQVDGDVPGDAAQVQGAEAEPQPSEAQEPNASEQQVTAQMEPQGDEPQQAETPRANTEEGEQAMEVDGKGMEQVVDQAEEPAVVNTEKQPVKAPRRRQSTSSKANLKRKREQEEEVLAAKVERLEKLIQQEQEVLKDKAAALEKAAAEFRKQEEVLAATRKSAAKAREELAALHMPEARELPLKPYNRFCKEMLTSFTGENGLKKMSAMWGALGDEGKQKYKDAYASEQREYNVWASSDEGRAILAKRHEVMMAQKGMLPKREARTASAGEALAAAEACVKDLGRESSPVGGGLHADRVDESPAKRAKVPDANATPQKQRSVARPVARLPIVAATPEIDEEVLQEAGKLSLNAQLVNLISRPEVQALKKSSQEILDALKAKDGMVNAAKRFLLEAAA